MCEWGAESGGSEEVQGEEAGGRKLGLTGVTIKISNGCAGG